MFDGISGGESDKDKLVRVGHQEYADLKTVAQAHDRSIRAELRVMMHKYLPTELRKIRRNQLQNEERED